MSEKQRQDLSGKILIAMPGMGDPRFEHAVVYLCAHSEDGAMGLIVNKPAGDLKLDAVLEQLGVPTSDVTHGMPVHFGGPVEVGRGFVLHSGDYRAEGATLRVNEDFAMTATVEILREIAAGRGPRERLMALGYAGWAPGQLEAELAQGGWLVGEPSPELVFQAGDAVKWELAVRALGIDPKLLSSSAGRA